MAIVREDEYLHAAPEGTPGLWSDNSIFPPYPRWCY